MSSPKAIAAFLGWLIAAFFAVSAITIYGFDYFEGAFGDRTDNLFLSMALYTALALVITAGFGAVLIWRRSASQSFQALRLLIAAAVACGLVHAVAFAGPFLDYVGSWQARLVVLAIYSALVGALVAGGLMWSIKVGKYAA